MRSLPGKPDLAFIGLKVAVFCDGAFWHGHPEHFTFGKSGAYWDEKIARTKERDRQADVALEGLGWNVIRFWDFEIAGDLDRCVLEVGQIVAARREEATPSPN